jgi:hypothetical protein
VDALDGAGERQGGRVAAATGFGGGQQQRGRMRLPPAKSE